MQVLLLLLRPLPLQTSSQQSSTPNIGLTPTTNAMEDRCRPDEWATLGTAELPVEKGPLVTLTLSVLEPPYRAPTSSASYSSIYLHRFENMYCVDRDAVLYPGPGQDSKLIN